MQSTSGKGGGSIGYVILLTLIAALGGLLFGYDTAVIAGAIGYLQARFDLTPFWEGFVAASALAGCALGAGSAGFVSDRFGRKKVLILAAAAFFISALGTSLPRNLVEFLVFRFIGGIGIGAASIISPMYIAEVTPFRIRGRMVSMNQFAIVSGMLIVYFVNFFITEHGIVSDKAVVESHRTKQGAALDPTFVREYLTKQTPAVVEQQIEEFLVRPHQKFDRWSVAQYAFDLGGSHDPKSICASPGGDATAPLSPAAVRDWLHDDLPEANRRQIDKFLEGNPSPDAETVAAFLARAKIKVDPIGISLAAHKQSSWNVAYGWRWMFGSGVVPALVFLVLLLAVPESPRWLTKNGRRDEALAILTRVDGPEFARGEIQGIEETLKDESGRLGELVEPWMRRVLVLGIALAVLQQVTGINVFLYFAPRIFESLGAGASTAMWQTVIVGAVNMAFTILAVVVVDRLGRRPLMLFGTVGMGVALTGLGLVAYWQLFQWWSLVFVLGYIACFAMSVGPVVWVILSEIFPTQIRGRAMGVATICLWLANYVVSLTYPMMSKNPWLLVRFHQGFPFWVYAAFCVVLLIVVLRWVPETKGKSLEEIERYWRKEGSRSSPADAASRGA
jgi:MFS family permease